MFSLYLLDGLWARLVALQVSWSFACDLKLRVPWHLKYTASSDTLIHKSCSSLFWNGL